MKKNFLLICLISFSFITSASVWDDIASCFKDPCNCGQGDSYEEWGGNTRSFEANALCPPWNKGDGRDPGTCLLQFNYPSAFTPFYMNHCAEQTEESTYFTPKIKVRVQNCNSFACWTESTSLNWDGECTVWPTGWGFPTLRICARLALPANPLTGTPADPGYTKGVHLNSEGFEEKDKIIYGIDGKAIAFDQPKVCAYRDPWLLSIIDVDGRSIIDLLDFNPVSQPLHHTAGIHPIAKIMIFLIENTSGNNMIDMLGNIFSNAGDNIAPGIGNLITKTMSIFKVVLNALDKIINFRNSLYVAVIKEFGQFNREVDDYHFGCVELPMGPYPPPFCPQIPPFVPTASVQTICPLNSSWVPTYSTVNDPCVVSNLVNNSVRNSIRVTLDNFVPLCSPTQAASGEASDKCVILSNINAAASASAMHTLTAKKDVIKPCNKAASGMPCAKTTIPFTCSVSSNGCQDGFRVVYGTQVGNQLVPSGYYIDELSDCGTGKSSNCQKIWGINTGEYIDVSLIYPQTEVSADLTDLSQDFTLSYNITDAQTGNAKSNAVNITAKIVRQSTTYSSRYNNLNQTTDMMCVFTSDYLAGCTNRQPAPKIKVYDCNSNFAKSNNLFCNNNGYYTPMLIGSIQDGKGEVDATSAVFEALSYKNSSTLAYQINLAGSDYLAFVTDDNYIMKPFSGSHSVNPSTIYGTYQNDDPPYYPDGTINNDAVYLTGLEYINARYIQGGTNICLQNLAAIHCPSDTTNCVLSNLLNNNIVSCSDFSNKLTKYNNLRLCSKSDTNCQNIDSMPGKNGGSGIQIMQCDTGFCYTNANNVEVCKQSLKPSDIYMPSEDDVIKNGAYYNVNDNTVDNNSLVVSSNNNNSNNVNNNGSVTVNNPNNTTTTYSVNNNNTGLNYNKDLYILRDKTPYELGACISIPQPKCPAITNPGPNDGNATWPETLVGEVAQGSCVNNGTTGNGQSLTRYCLSNIDTGEIKFQPIKAGQGCKVSSINLTSVVNNVPDYVQPQTQTNTAGQSGNVQLNSDHWEDSKKLQAGEYSSKLTFNVQGMSSIDYFRVTQLAYDDYVLITINGKKIYSGPWSFNTLSYTNGQALVDGSSQGSQNGFRNNNLNLDLTPYLVEGTNTIEIKAVVYDVGTIAYLIEYQMKQQ